MYIADSEFYYGEPKVNDGFLETIIARSLLAIAYGTYCHMRYCRECDHYIVDLNNNHELVRYYSRTDITYYQTEANARAFITDKWYVLDMQVLGLIQWRQRDNWVGLFFSVRHGKNEPIKHYIAFHIYYEPPVAHAA